MRTATIVRNPSTPDGTFGLLTTDSGKSWATGELPWDNNNQGTSCIPEGVYTCRWFNSPKHGWCYQVYNDPNRSYIEIHSANFPPQQLQGCIALGKDTGMLATFPGARPQMAVLRRKQAIAEFEEDMNASLFRLTIISKEPK